MEDSIHNIKLKLCHSMMFSIGMIRNENSLITVQYLEKNPHQLVFHVDPLSWSNGNLKILVFVEGEGGG